MTTWLYRFTENPRFPEPLQEIAALAAIDDETDGAWLMLAQRQDPPGKSAEPGDEFLLCASSDGRLQLHGRGIIRGTAQQLPEPPPSVRPLYSPSGARLYLPLERLELCTPSPIPGLEEAAVARFTSGQAYVKRLDHVSIPSATRIRALPTQQLDVVRFPAVRLATAESPFVVAGLDPTAGDWTHRMTRGDAKPMPCVVLAWTGNRFEIVDRAGHFENATVWEQLRHANVRLLCIDGPCGTNGLRLKPDWSGWDYAARGGKRSGELALHSEGVKLYWTTHATISNFDGASRWIARSLRLFSDPAGDAFGRIETHPHGAFRFLWREFGRAEALAAKTRPEGRAARLAVLQAFVPDLNAAELPDHDAVDAACAALMAGLHVLRMTSAFGDASDGGAIWMPRLSVERSVLAAEDRGTHD